MNTGDYIRTKQGIIGKVIKEEPFMDDTHIYLDNGKGNITLTSIDGVFKVNCKRDIIKSSPNIIDLIEVGDYVNGAKVEDIDKGKYLLFEHNVSYVDVGIGTYTNGRVDGIESIVTKEQFEQIEYKVGE